MPLCFLNFLRYNDSIGIISIFKLGVAIYAKVYNNYYVGSIIRLQLVLIEMVNLEFDVLPLNGFISKIFEIEGRKMHRHN